MPQKDQDRFNLQRFIEAQNSCYSNVIKELSEGEKISHWIWFIFPQIDGLGHSVTAQKYAIKSLAEAQAYLQHPVLGKRLMECTRLLIATDHSNAEAIFGYPDYLKFHSSMTLFAGLNTSPAIFQDALIKFYAGAPDQSTLDILNINRSN